MSSDIASVVDKVVSELSERHIEELHSLYQKEWWTKGRTLDATRRGIKGSQIVIGLLDGADSLIGFARVITDYTFKALIFDVIVAENARDHGLGSHLVSLVTSHDALRNVRHFELYCLPELIEFYEAHGFKSDVGKIQLMRRTCESA
jgi:GNAT superfamily N-acetyltransferase